MNDNSRVVEFPKPWKRKLDRVRKKTPFRFDPIPSLLIEEWLPLLTLPELRCLLYICRRTWGFKKEWDAITIEQFCRGVKNREGKQVDVGIGFGETYVRDTLRGLEKRGLIEIKHRKTRAHLYRLTIKPGCTMSEPQEQPEAQSGVH